MSQREVYWKHVYFWEANIVLTPKREHDSIGNPLTFPGRDRYSCVLGHSPSFIPERKKIY